MDADFSLKFKGKRRITHTGGAVCTNDHISNWNTSDMLVVMDPLSVYQTLQDWCLFDSKEGILLMDGIENEINGCRIGDSLDGPLIIPYSSCVNARFINCKFDGADDQVFYFNQNIINLLVKDCESGGILDNGTFCRIFSNASNPPKYTNCLIENSLISDSNYWNGTGNENNTGSGSSVRVQNYQQTEQHYTYLPRGNWENTGSGLADTTTRTATGHGGIRFSPTDTDIGVVIEFKIPCRIGTAPYWVGYFRENAAFFGDSNASTKVELLLPGSSVADNTCDFSASAADIANGEICLVAAAYLGSVNSEAKVRITVKTKTAGAYLYLFDMFDGKNALTDMSTWRDARPTEYAYLDFNDPAGVWTVPTSGNTVSGSFGEMVASSLKDAVDAALAYTNAIKAKTDLLAFAGNDVKATLDGEEVSANIKKVNDYAVTGDGSAGNTWGPA